MTPLGMVAGMCSIAGLLPTPEHGRNTKPFQERMPQ